MDFLANDVKNLITKGNLLAELGHHDEAISYYLKILQLEPDNQDVLMNLGNSLIALKKYPESIICYDDLLKTDPNNSLAWQQKGYSLLQMNRIEEAISCLDFSIQNDLHNSYAFFLLASMLVEMGKFNEAIFCYDKCLETCDPDFYFKASWSKGLAFDKLIRKNESDIQEKNESNSSFTTNGEESPPTPTRALNYYESVGYIQDFNNNEIKEPAGDSRQWDHEVDINASVENEGEPDYSYDYSPERDEEYDEEYDERTDFEMKNLGDYNLIQYYRTGFDDSKLNYDDNVDDSFDDWAEFDDEIQNYERDDTEEDYELEYGDL